MTPSPHGLLRDGARLLALALVPAALTLWLHPKRPILSWHPPAVDTVELSTVDRWSERVLWVDARKAEAYQQQHIPRAILLNESEWERLLPRFLEVWAPKTRVVVYCDSQQCDASQAVALRLRRELGLQDVFVLKEGWKAWQQKHP